MAVGSEVGAKRLMFTVSDRIRRKLRLKVNMSKARTARPTKLKYLGFGFRKDGKAKDRKCRPNEDFLKKFNKTYIGVFAGLSRTMPFS